MLGVDLGAPRSLVPSARIGGLRLGSRNSKKFRAKVASNNHMALGPTPLGHGLRFTQMIPRAHFCLDGAFLVIAPLILNCVADRHHCSAPQ